MTEQTTDEQAPDEQVDPRLTAKQRVEMLARALAENRNDRGEGNELVWEAYTADAKVLLTALPDLGYIDASVPATEEWAVQEKTFLDGPFDRIDTGGTWSNRRGQKYTKREARKEAKMRINRLDPELWRRAVTRTVHYGPWIASPGRPVKKPASGSEQPS